MSLFTNMKKSGQKIAALTCYDATMAKVLAAAGLDLILIGDSLGQLVQGKSDTLSVTPRDIKYHLQCVRSSFAGKIIADMPFGSYEKSDEQAFSTASKFIAAGADMVKLEGGEIQVQLVAGLRQRGVPVCAHIGLQPQQVRLAGGYYVQGKDKSTWPAYIDLAKRLEGAGAQLILLELMHRELAEQITQAVSIATIGIGSGVNCDGQILVLYDVLGVGVTRKIMKNFMQDSDSIADAVQAYVRAVKQGSFPALEQSPPFD